MEINSLKDYLKNNSIGRIRQRAENIHVKLISLNQDLAEYTYQGTARKPYKIDIYYKEGSVQSNCSCAYDLEGICKHRIAAINQLIEGLENGDIIFLGQTPTPPKEENFEIIRLENGSFNFLKICEINKKKPSSYSYYSYFEIKVSKVAPQNIETTYTEWNKFHSQKFEYDEAIDAVKTSCSCNAQSKKLCIHRIEALLHIKNTFGENFFSKTFMEDEIELALQGLGFTKDDNWQEVFSFALTPKGIEATSKFKNMAELPEKPISFFDTEAGKTISKLPLIKNKDNEFGLGFCVQYIGNKAEKIFPVKAKFNKTKTDFSSTFSEIGYDNLYKYIQDFDEGEDEQLIMKSLKINSLLSSYIHTRSVDSVVRAIQFFSDVYPLYKTKHFYLYNSRKNLVRKNLSPLQFSDVSPKLFFKVQKSEFFFTLKAFIDIAGKKLTLTSNKLTIGMLFVIHENVVYPFENAHDALHVDVYKNQGEINYRKKDVKQLYENIIQPLSENFEIESDILQKGDTFFSEEDLEKHVYISDEAGELITFKLAVQYPNKLMSVFSQEALVSDANEEKVIFAERNQAYEDDFIEKFRSLHPSFETQNSTFYLYPEQLLEKFWLIQATEKMKTFGFKVFGANDLKSFKFNVNKPIISVSVSSDIDWFDLEIDVSFGDQKVGLKDLQKAFLKKTNYVELGDGTLGILPKEWMKKFENYFRSGEVKKNGIQISNYQFGIIDELYLEMETRPDFFEQLYEKKKRLQNLSNISNNKVPKEITASLRDYQVHGFNWMVFLDENQLGGCLADDMGLGKTLQTITFLQYLKNKKKEKKPSLIIAPTSLIFNWQNEIKKFCPTLSILPFVGNNRFEFKNDFENYDIVISTYGSLLNDVEFLKDYHFHYIILDESQAIKNPNSKRYKAVRLLQSYNRLILTGTPIENNTYDLYAQFNFINPGLLGSMKHFKSQFSDAIDKEKNEDASKLLSRIIAPFILRRTKEQVVKELPDKTESVIYCEMQKEQRKVYETFKDRYRDYLMKKFEDEGVEKAQMYILEGLTKLRQICNSTALLPESEDYGNYSAKLEVLIENIKEKTGNHKILVFSQFVKMLQLIKSRLEDENISYEYLDGQTRNRQEKVENFQDNKEVRVFLISLKAGGTGLNLTEADYVFIVDPWWNPAVENQAIDRCYRIGQTKNVMAYRMICKDTIEEKIVSLQESKKEVASSIIQIDKKKKSFNVQQVKELFS